LSAKIAAGQQEQKICQKTMTGNGIKTSLMTLEQAIQSIQSGDMATGRRLLGQLLRAEPGNAEAWLWMSEAVDRQEHKLDCLLRALTIEPENAFAQTSLAELRGELPEQPKVAVIDTMATISTSTSRSAVGSHGQRAAAETVQNRPDLYDPAQEARRRRGYRNIMLAAMMVLSAVCGIVLIVVTLTVVKPRGQERLKPTPETVLYEATLWCLPCAQNNSPIILWEKVGDGVSRGGQVGQLLHNTTVSVLAEMWSEPEERTYFKVAAEGQQGWVPETFIKKDAAIP
jgi:hypothetical protein